MSEPKSAEVVAIRSAALARVEPVDRSIVFSKEQRQVILDTCCGGASASESGALIAIAQARGLNPILGDCYFVKRYDTQAGAYKWAVQASIDSFRSRADETGLYGGQDEPEYEYSEEDYQRLPEKLRVDGAPTLARVKVYRTDIARPFVGVARWGEYVQTTKDKVPSKFWRESPHNQLAKCAEELALRKAFPKVFQRVHGTEEMGRADREEMAGEVVDRTPSEELAAAVAASATQEELQSVVGRAKADLEANRITRAEGSEIVKLANERARVLRSSAPVATTPPATPAKTEPSPAPQADGQQTTPADEDDPDKGP